MGDQVSLHHLPKSDPVRLEPEDIPLDIVYEDEDLVIIHKPAGLVVHPGGGIKSGTLANGLLRHFKNLSRADDPWRPGIVHRLDKDTSGLMAVAKHDRAHNGLAEQLADHSMRRTYFALVWGEMPEVSGTINASITRHRHQREKMTISPMGKNAVTHYKILCYYNFTSLVQFNLETGRTHQIRVHSQYLRHPIVGDTIYGYKQTPPPIVHTMNRNPLFNYLAILKRKRYTPLSWNLNIPYLGNL